MRRAQGTLQDRLAGIQGLYLPNIRSRERCVGGVFFPVLLLDHVRVLQKGANEPVTAPGGM